MEGIIVVNKKQGITSFDVIRGLRKILKEKKIGHTGTLDPLATGVLIICVGKATKLAQDIEGYTKEYIAEFELGYKTDSYDIDGKIIKKSNSIEVSTDKLQEILERFKGKQKQEPPMYSAIKVNGQKLYELARKGIEIERKKRDIEVYDIELLEFNGIKGKIRCKVSKGTYIRSLINDIGEVLGTYATMVGLERTQVGDESISKSYTLEEIETMYRENNLSFILDVKEYIRYPRLDLQNEKDKVLFKNGQRCKIKNNDGYYHIYYNNNFLGIGCLKDNLLKGYKYY